MKAARVNGFYIPRGLAIGRSAGQRAKPDMVGGEALLRRPVRIGQLTGSQITKPQPCGRPPADGAVENPTL